MSVIPIIPPQTTDANLITAINDRIRRINIALGESSSSESAQVAQIVRAAFSAQPIGLKTADAGLLWHVTDYAHLLMWTGKGWEFCDGGGNFIAMHPAAPGVGWHICDGTSTDYLAIASGVVSKTSFTTPTPPFYMKGGVAYTGSVNAAVVPTIGADTDLGGKAASGSTSSLFALQGHSHNASLGGDPVANLVMLPYFRR